MRNWKHWLNSLPAFAEIEEEKRDRRR